MKRDEREERERVERWKPDLNFCVTAGGIDVGLQFNIKLRNGCGCVSVMFQGARGEVQVKTSVCPTTKPDEVVIFFCN